MKIEVTAQDIVEGQQCCCHSCPVAKALARVFYRCEVQVHKKWILIRESASKYAYYSRLPAQFGVQVMPPGLARFIWMFDQYFKVKPFSFELPEPIWLNGND